MREKKSQPASNPKTDKKAEGSDWGRAETELSKRSDALTKDRLTGSRSQKYEERFKEFGVSLPSITPTADRSELTKDEKALKTLQKADAVHGLEVRAKFNVLMSQADKLHRDLLRDYETPPLQKIELFKKLDEVREGLKTQYEQDLQSSPEACMAARVADLRALCRNYKRGRIVQTPYVKDKVREITENLATGKVVFISGETGIGKTEIARIASKKFSGEEPLVVRGYAGMSSDELFGHMSLTVDKAKNAAALQGEVDGAMEQFKKRFPNPTPEQEAGVVQAVLSKSSATVSEYILGSVYKAAQEGRTVIIDEANYIPPELLAKLNDILTKRPGERISVQEDGIGPIEVKKGFGMIFTGNVNPPTGPAARRYIGRHLFDLAFQDRISMVPYTYLPQAVEGQCKDFTPEQKQLFMVAVTTALLPSPRLGTADVLEKLENRHGTCLLPGGERGLETLWKFTQFAAVTQQAFAGEIQLGSAHSFQTDGTSQAKQTSVSLSPRAFMRVIESWRDDGFQKELDQYIAKDLLLRALDPADKAYLYQLGTLFGFFKSKGWDKDPNYGDWKNGRFKFSLPDNKSEPADIVPARLVISSIYGEIPGRITWPDGAVAQQVKVQNNAAAWGDLTARFSNLTGDLEGLIGKDVGSKK